MNNGPLLFFGILATLAGSFWGFLLAPQVQFGGQQAVYVEEASSYYPSQRSGEAKQGAEVYRSLGCVECHTQQVRGLNGDLDRSWSRRISVAQDYLNEDPVLLGQSRLGPDLTNIGLRQPDLNQYLVRLWNPRLVMPGSLMPRYPFLFEKRRIEPSHGPSPSALRIDGLEEGWEIVPKPEARQLAAYLLSLRADLELFEAPVPVPATNRVVTPSASAGTNGVASPKAAKSPTNSPTSAK